MAIVQLNPLISFGNLNPKVMLTKQIKHQPAHPSHFLKPKEKLEKKKNECKGLSYT